MARYCVLCGHELVTSDNQMYKDIYGDEEMDDKDDKMITYCHCSNCNADYEMFDASENEKEWNENFIGRMEVYISQEDEEI